MFEDILEKVGVKNKKKSKTNLGFTVKTLKDDLKGNEKKFQNSFGINSAMQKPQTFSQPTNNQNPYSNLPNKNINNTDPSLNKHSNRGKIANEALEESQKKNNIFSSFKNLSSISFLKKNPSLKFLIPVLVVVLIGGVIYSGYSYYQNNLIEKDSQPPNTLEEEEEENGDEEKDDPNEENNNNSNTLSNITDITKFVPLDYSYYLYLKKGTEASSDILYDKIKEVVLEETLSQQTLSYFDIDITTDFTWNKKEFIYIPELTQTPDENTTTNTGLIVLSIENSSNAEEFQQRLKSSQENSNQKENLTGYEILEIENPNGQLFYMAFLANYALFSLDQTVLMNTINLYEENSTNSNINTTIFDQIENQTLLKIDIGPNTLSKLAEKESVILNFKEAIVALNTQMYDWSSFSGAYLFMYLEENKINHNFVFSELSSSYQTIISQWETTVFENFKDIYKGVSLTAPPIFKGKEYQGIQKKYSLLKESGSTIEASIDYAILGDKYLLITDSFNGFNKTLDSYLKLQTTQQNTTSNSNSSIDPLENVSNPTL